MKKFYLMNLSLFADAGTLVNATGNYVNAYTGATTAFTDTSTLTPTMKTFYDTELLENHRDQLIFAQLGRKQGLPARRGRTIEWRKWNTLPLCQELTEGVIPTGEKMGMTAINVALAQYGEYVAVTDLLELHALDDVIAGAVEELGAAGGKTHDLLVRNVLKGGTNILFADAINKSTGAYVSTPTSEATLLTAMADYDCFLTPDMINKAYTNLVTGGAPEKIVERVIEVVPPARTGIVVSDVADPVANVPPPRSPGSIFGNMDRNRLAALEAAAQRELAKGRKFGLGAGLFGRKR